MKLNKLLSVLLCVLFMIPCVSISANAISDTERVLEDVNRVFSDPNATMTDIIRVTNPDAYARMTEEQRADFEAFRYQDVKQGVYDDTTAAAAVTVQLWDSNIYTDAYCPKIGTIKYGCVFFSIMVPSVPVGPECSFVGLTGTVIDTDNGNKRIAFESESGRDTDYLTLESEVSEGVIGGHHYDIEFEAYGYNPKGEPFVIYKTKSITAK